MTQQLTREEQERQYPEYTWDLSTIFESDNAFEDAFKDVENNIGEEQQTLLINWINDSYNESMQKEGGK